MGKPKIVELVLLAGGCPNWRDDSSDLLPPLAFALSSRKYEAARVLLKYGMRDDYQLGRTGATTLMTIAFDHELASAGDIVDELVRAGALPNAVDIKGSVPLYWSARLQNGAYVERLLSLGADGCEVNRKGQRAADVVPDAATALKKRLCDACKTRARPSRPRARRACR